MDHTLHDQITRLPWFTAAPPTYTAADIASG
jgi:hypothetical protein